MARPRFQEGSLTRWDGKWLLKWREYGTGRSIQRTKTLCAATEYPRESDVRREYGNQIRGLIGLQNEKVSGTDGNLTVGEFIDNRYFSRLEQRLQFPPR
jgi:hypothetical protein